MNTRTCSRASREHQHRRLSFWQRLDPTQRRRVAKRAWGGILDGNITEACSAWRESGVRV